MESQHTAAGEEARKASARVAESVREQSESVKQHARDTGKHVFNEQRAAVACSTQHLASALHTAANQLRDNGESLVGSYAAWAANGLDRFSEQITHQDFEGFIHRASRFTRERPEIVFGGALLAGIALTRLLKYSAEPERHDEEMPASELPMEPVEPVITTTGSPYRTE